MTVEFTIDNIDNLQAIPLNGSDGWAVSFYSENPGMYHQLYINGQLAQFTDTTDQRTFNTKDEATGSRIAVIAVDQEYLATDFSHALPADHGRPCWVKSVQLIRDIALPAGTIVSLLTDHTTGQIDPAPLASQQVWPAWNPRWAWGEDAFGHGGFGYDGYLSPGAGQAAFGAGMFGFGADIISLSGLLLTEGDHQLVLRTTGPDGQFTDQQLSQKIATPPPQPCEAITVTAYDNQTNQLTFEIN